MLCVQCARATTCAQLHRTGKRVRAVTRDASDGDEPLLREVDAVCQSPLLSPDIS